MKGEEFITTATSEPCVEHVIAKSSSDPTSSDERSVMNCPKCRLINLPEAIRCDCGYDFISGQMEHSYLPQEPLAITRVSLNTRAVLGIILLGLSDLGFYIVGSQPSGTDPSWGGPGYFMFFFLFAILIGVAMKKNYNELGQRIYGWVFILGLLYCTVACVKNPIWFGPALGLFVLAWIHTNTLLTKRLAGPVVIRESKIRIKDLP